MDPLSISAIILSCISTIGTITLAIIQIFKNNSLTCDHFLKSNCCYSNNSSMDIHDNKNVNIDK